MNERINILGVIGARSGSKSIPHKNIRPLLGKPLLAWIAEAAQKSKYITRLILSTDSAEYAEVGKKYGLEAPFLRPKNLAEDKSTDTDYLIHAVEWLEKNEGWKPDFILRLPPTSPLCRPEFIDRCVELLLNDPSADSARSVALAPKHPYKLWREDGKYLAPFVPKEFSGLEMPANLPRQLFPPAYIHTGVIAVRYETLMKKKTMGEKIRFHVIPKENAVDIDNENDFRLAEILLKK